MNKEIYRRGVLDEEWPLLDDEGEEEEETSGQPTLDRYVNNNLKMLNWRSSSQTLQCDITTGITEPIAISLRWDLGLNPTLHLSEARQK